VDLPLASHRLSSSSGARAAQLSSSGPDHTRVKANLRSIGSACALVLPGDQKLAVILNEFAAGERVEWICSCGCPTTGVPTDRSWSVGWTLADMFSDL